MFNKLFKNSIEVDFKKRYRLLIAFVLFIILLIYIVSIKPTLVLWQKSNEIEKQYTQLQNNPNELATLKSKLQSYGSNNTVTFTSQNISDEISKYCVANGLKESYPTPIKTQNGDLIVETDIFVITGGFHKITQLAYFMEQEKKIGKLISLQYEMKKNFETRSNYLEATFYLQTIKNNKDEK